VTFDVTNRLVRVDERLEVAPLFFLVDRAGWFRRRG
jgi:hypothetical protein